MYVDFKTSILYTSLKIINIYSFSSMYFVNYELIM